MLVDLRGSEGRGQRQERPEMVNHEGHREALMPDGWLDIFVRIPK